MNKTTARRIDQLRSRALVDGPQAMLVTKVKNVQYLTGFTGDSTYLFLTRTSAILLSDSRFTTQLAEECPGFELEIRDSRVSMLDMLEQVIQATKVSQLAYESHSLTKQQYDEFSSRLAAVTLCSSNGHVEALREIKDKEEINEIRFAIHLAERAFDVIRASLTPVQTEAEIAANIEHQIRMFGGYGCAFEPIVGVGPRAALPHAVKTNRQIKESPFVLIDWGARGRHYLSDLTRVLVTGKPTKKLEKIYNIVLAAQQAAIKLIRPGAKLSAIDAAARGVIEKAGYGPKFGHGLGHGFGLEIHETPRLSPIAAGTLQTGMVVTVEPGIYLPDWGGVRIEDDILVTADGHEVLTNVPKEFEQSLVTL
jgi:Xaa-Pro aminopeptidase